MANLVEQINSIEETTIAKEKEYLVKIDQLDEAFESTKQALQAEADLDFAQFQTNVIDKKNTQFEEIKANFNQQNQQELYQIEADINNRRDELAQIIAKKVVNQIWQ